MRPRFTLACVLLTFAPALLHAAEPGLADLGPAGEITKVRGGFQFTEGPAWDHHGTLYFSDIPANRIYQLKNGEVSVFLEEAGHTNGLIVDAAGTLFACRMDGEIIAVDPKSKKVTTVTDKYMGRRYNAPNDLVVDRQGGLYFTDPHFRSPQPLPQGKTAVYYVDAGGKVTRLVDDLPAPNGVILSPDEKTLYVIPTGQKDMMAYPVEAPGRLGKGRVFCSLKQKQEGGNSGGDGLAIDAEGNLYITSVLGLQVFNPEGEALGIIEFPEQPANATFGGPDLKTLYVTARTGLYAAPMKVKGHAFKGKGK